MHLRLGYLTCLGIAEDASSGIQLRQFSPGHVSQSPGVSGERMGCEHYGYHEKLLSLSGKVKGSCEWKTQWLWQQIRWSRSMLGSGKETRAGLCIPLVSIAVTSEGKC